MLGEADVDGMLRRMTLPMFMEWLAFGQIEPYGAEMDNWRAGQVCATIANVHRGKGKAYKPDDFMPRTGPRVQSPEEITARFKMFAKAHNAALRNRQKAGME